MSSGDSIDSAPARSARSRPEPLLAIAIALFIIGILAIAVLLIVPAVAGGDAAPAFVGILTTCAPLGFLCGLIFALRSGRRAQARRRGR